MSSLSLNPDAPLYTPFSQLSILTYYSPPPYLSLQPYHIYLNQNPFQITIDYTSPPPYLPPSHINYCISPFSGHNFFRIKQFSLAGDFPRLPPPPPLIGLEEHEGTTLPLLAEDYGRTQSQISDMQAKEVKEEEKGGESYKFNSQSVRMCGEPKGLLSGSGYLSGRGLSWRPKLRSIRKPSLLPPPKEDFEFKEEEDEGVAGFKTTVMIKNLPNKFTKKRLLELLDGHCLKENQKLQVGLRAGDSNTTSEFDFLYLPMDFSSGSNLGYAFVNFTSARAAWKLHRELHKQAWNELGSRKVCEVTYARIQGLPALLSHFRNSVFFCETDDYLPVYFIPNRNGLRESEQHYVGKRYSSISEKPRG